MAFVFSFEGVAVPFSLSCLVETSGRKRTALCQSSVKCDFEPEDAWPSGEVSACSVGDLRIIARSSRTNVLQWLPSLMPGIVQSVLGHAAHVSVYYDRV